MLFDNQWSSNMRKQIRFLNQLKSEKEKEYTNHNVHEHEYDNEQLLLDFELELYPECALED
jgi:hypothetical protein